MSKLVCANCSSELVKDQYSTGLDNELYCDGCYSETFSSCDNCGNVAWNDDTTWFNESLWCLDCKDDNLFSCSDCGDLTHNDQQVTTVDLEYICESCYSDNYSVCSNCDEVYLVDDTNYCETHCEAYCFDCWDDHRDYTHDGNEPSEQESYPKKEQFHKGKKCKLVSRTHFMGVEIEAEKVNGNVSYREFSFYGDDSGFVVKGDGSLSNGVEINTPPSSGIELVKAVKRACKELKNNNYQISPRCGLHVHIDLRDRVKNYTFLSHLFSTFFAIEDVMYSMQPQSRLNSTYCVPLRKIFNFYDFFGRQYIKEFPKKYKSKTGRYAGFNFTALDSHGTLEVRLHSGSMNPTKILRWCDLIQHVVDWVTTSHDYKTVEKLLNLDVAKDRKEKLKLMKRVFKLSTPLMAHIDARLDQFGPRTIDYQMGNKVVTKQQLQEVVINQLRSRMEGPEYTSPNNFNYFVYQEYTRKTISKEQAIAVLEEYEKKNAKEVLFYKHSYQSDLYAGFR